MSKRNGYFQLEIAEAELRLRLFPPLEGGKPIEMSEVLAYLNDIKVKDYDLRELNQQVSQLQEEKSVFLCKGTIYPVHERAKIQILADRMTAVIRLYPPCNKGKAFDRRELVSELNLAGVRYGIIERVVDALVANPIYCQNIIIAKGKAVREGTDARIEYHFETQPLAKPKMNEDGSVDFHELNIFTKVTEHQLLATLYPEDKGEEGIDILGNRVLPRKVKRAMLKCGRNIRLSEDRLQMFSEVNGDVKLEGDTVFVSDSYTVAADVDASTGDIHYEGDVIINGNVRTGFTVEAKGDIQVRGVVEGAVLIAGGNIVLARGIQGMNRGRLEAKGDIVAKFIESATVKAAGSVRSSSILHSKVDAGDTILCEGRHSYIIGGSLSAMNLIQSKSVGNQMETATDIKLGIDMQVLEEYKQCQQEYEQNEEKLTKCNQILLLFSNRVAAGQGIPTDKIALIKETGNQKKMLEERQKELDEIIDGIQQLIDAEKRGKLKVLDCIYPGTRVFIANELYMVKKEMKFVQFSIRDGEIVVSSC